MPAKKKVETKVVVEKAVEPDESDQKPQETHPQDPKDPKDPKDPSRVQEPEPSDPDPMVLKVLESAEFKNTINSIINDIMMQLTQRFNSLVSEVKSTLESVKSGGNAQEVVALRQELLSLKQILFSELAKKQDKIPVNMATNVASVAATPPKRRL